MAKKQEESQLDGGNSTTTDKATISEKVDVKKVVVKFKIPYGRYSPSDIAGFDTEQAKELVEQRKVAEYFKP